MSFPIRTIPSVLEFHQISLRFRRVMDYTIGRDLHPAPKTFLVFTLNGVGGSRTRVQKPIPCTSTIIVCSLTFPPLHENKHPYRFSSFINLSPTQSFACDVPYKVDALILAVGH